MPFSYRETLGKYTYTFTRDEEPVVFLPSSEGATLCLDFSNVDDDYIWESQSDIKFMMRSINSSQNIRRLEIISQSVCLAKWVSETKFIEKYPKHQLKVIDLSKTPVSEDYLYQFDTDYLYSLKCAWYQESSEAEREKELAIPSNLKTQVLIANNQEFQKRFALYLTLHRLGRDPDLSKAMAMELVRLIEKHDANARDRGRILNPISRHSEDYNPRELAIGISSDDRAKPWGLFIGGLNTYFKSQNLEVDDLHSLFRCHSVRGFIDDTVKYEPFPSLKIMALIAENNTYLWQEIYGIYPELTFSGQKAIVEKEAESEPSLSHNLL